MLRWAPHFSSGGLAWGEHFGVAPGPVEPPAPSLVVGVAAGATLATCTVTDASGGTAAHRVQVRVLPNGTFADAVGATNPMPAGTLVFPATGMAAGLRHEFRARAERSGLQSGYTTSTPHWQDVAVGGGGELPGTGPLDTTPPALTAGSVSGGQLAAAYSITSDEAGTLFWRVNRSATPLTIPAVPAAMSGWSTRALVAGVNAGATGALAAGAGYYLHLCAQDGQPVPNRRPADLVLGPFTVLAPVVIVGRVVVTRAPAERKATSMGTAQLVEVMDVAESDLVTFDFSSELAAAGATIPSLASLQWEVDVISGRDPEAGQILVDAAVLEAGNRIVRQKVACRGFPGRYAIRLTATCSDGLKRVAVMVLPVQRLGNARAV